MFPENIIYVGLFFSLLAYYFYFKDIFYGKTRPNLVSWFLWMLGPFIGVFFELRAGAGLSVISIFIAGFGPFVVILVSLFRKTSIWKINSLDILCGTLSLLALLFYILTHNLGISIIFAILSDALACIPTLVKSWNFPETETSTVYLAGIFSNTLGLLIIKNWIFPIYSFNIYFVVMNILIVFCIYHKKVFKKKIIA